MTVRILQGHCVDVMRTMAAGSVDCVMTSPPYWGLRNYELPAQVWGGVYTCRHQWGEEVTETRSAKRGVEGSTLQGGKQQIDQTRFVSRSAFCGACGAWIGDLGLEPTPDHYIANLVSVFREVHRVLNDAGTVWLNIGDCYVGARGGAQGENGQMNDRTAAAMNVRVRNQDRLAPGLKNKDLVMMPARVALALQADGWYVRKDIIWHKPNPMPESVVDRPTSSHEHVFLLTKSESYFYDADAVRTRDGGRPSGNGFDRADAEGNHYRMSTNPGSNARWLPGGGANLRDVWTIPTKPSTVAHFAMFPEELVEPCVKAGCPVGGTVMDPFGGTGTVGIVANRFGRDAVLIELGERNVEIASGRLRTNLVPVDAPHSQPAGLPLLDHVERRP